MRRAALILVALAACQGGHKRPPADAAPLGPGMTSPPFRIELPGTLPSAVVALPDGGALVAMSFTQPIDIAGTRFEPKHGPDALVVSIAGDGQPRAAVSLGLDGAASVRVADLARAPDGTVRAGVITDVALPGAHGTPSPGPEAGGQIYTVVAIDLARGVTDEIAIGPVAPGGTTAITVLADGAMRVTRTGSRVHGPPPPSVVSSISADGDVLEEISQDPEAAAEPSCAPWKPDVVSVLDAQACRTVVKVLGGTRKPGVYAAGATALEPAGDLPANEPTPAAILADGAVLVVGACDARRTAGCLVRANPSWR